VWLHHPLFLGTERDVDDIADALVKIHEHRSELGGLAEGSAAKRLRS
jgi:hypothetical protein